MSRQRITLPASLKAVHHQNATVPSAPLDVRRKATVSPEQRDPVHGLAGEGPVRPPTGDRSAAENGALKELLESIRSEMEELEQRRQQSLNDMQQAAIELAIAVAARIVRTVIDREQYRVDALASELVSRLASRGPVTIALHPEDRMLLERQLDGQSDPWGAGVRVTLTTDPTLHRGSCHAATPETELLSDVQWHAADIREVLLEALEDAQVERRQTQTGDRALRRFPDRRETA